MQSIKSTFSSCLHSPHWSFLKWAFYSTLLFALLKLPFSFPFLADDYKYLYFAASPKGLSFSDLGHVVARCPVFALATYFMFKNQIWESTWFPLYILFFIQAFSIFLLVDFVYGKFSIGDESALTDWKHSPFIVACLIFVFYPSHHEIMYFPLPMTNILGTLFLALGIRQKRWWASGFLLSLSFLTSETFLLPGIFLSTLEVWINLTRYRSTAQDSVRNALYALALSTILFFLSRQLLSLEFGQITYGLSLNPKNIFINFWNNLKMLWSIHFYKTNYVSTILELSVLSFLSWYLWKRKVAPLTFFVALFAIIYFSAANLLVLNYYAPRAFYGPLLLKCAFGGSLMSMFLKICDSKTLKYVIVGIMSLAYGLQTFIVFSIKDRNYHLLQTKSASFGHWMETCVEPCRLKVADLDDGLKRDFVLPPTFWKSYLQWIQTQYAPQKDIAYDFQKGDN